MNAEAKFDEAAKALKIARAALGRSRSKKNVLAFVEAEAAFNAALDAVNAEREAMEASEAIARRARRMAAVGAEKARRAYAQPSLF